MPDISIITVSWNVKDYLRESLEAVFANAGDVSLEVFVVDNNSSDGTRDMLREFAQREPRLTVLCNNTNVGFARANNQAIEQASGRYVLLLNPDMRVFSDTLANMTRWMDAHPRVGVAGCHLVTDAGETVRHVRRFPGLWNQLAIVLKIPHLFPRVLDRYLMRDFDYTKEARVDSVRGSFFMIRREALRVGLLDERFFIWFEEVDFCKRMRSAGWEVWYTPAARCVDRVGRSFAQVGGIKKQKMFLESMYLYFDKWGDWRYRVVVWVARPVGLLLVLAGNFFTVILRFAKRAEGSN